LSLLATLTLETKAFLGVNSLFEIILDDIK